MRRQRRKPQARRGTHSSHLNDHRKETFPTSLSSTTIDGLKSSRVLCRLAGFGEEPLINSDPDIGSEKDEGKNYGQRYCVPCATFTGHADFVRRALNPELAIMHDSGRVHEVNSIRIFRVGGKLQGKEVLVEAHDWRMSRM